MPSIVSTILRGQIRLLSPFIGGATLEQARRGQDALGKLGTRAMEGSVCFHELRFPDFDAAWAIPLKGQVRRAILYLHGGAYTAGGLPYAKGFGGQLAELSGRATLCVGYRLAPEHPFPAALEDALAAYKEMLTRFAPSEIAFVGESAGGGLCYSLCLYLKQLRLPQPEQVIAISPWTDLQMQRDVSALAALDPLLDHAGLMENALRYGGQARENPLISPLLGDPTGLPPSLIIVGGHEILLDDSRLMQRKLREAGCRCDLHVEEGLWHVYVLYGVPEAKTALRHIEERLRRAAP